MSVSVYVLECIVMCTVFGVSIFGMLPVFAVGGVIISLMMTWIW